MILQDQIRAEFTNRYIPCLNNGFYGNINGRHVHAVCVSGVAKKWRFVLFESNDSIGETDDLEHAVAFIELGILF